MTPPLNAFRPFVEPLEPRRVPTVTFAGPQTFASGGVSVAVADFSGDGRPDFAVVDDFSGAVTVLRNTTPAGSSTPSFAAPQAFVVGTSPRAVAVGDFNGDGRPDLVVTNVLDNTVSVLLNTTPAGSATLSFAAQQTFAVGSDPSAIAVGDFEGDGRPDLAVASGNSSTVSVLMNTTVAGAATVSFAPAQTFAVSRSPDAVAVADFNGDGRPDLAVANGGDSTLSVLLNTTSAGASILSFATQQTFAHVYGPRSLVVSDFNGDGRPDLAVAIQSDNTVAVLLNTTPAGSTTATFGALLNFAAGNGTQTVAAGDFDGDGRPDLAVTSYLDGGVMVLLNETATGSSTPSFEAQYTDIESHGSYGLGVGDFNGDGRPDLAVASFLDNTIDVKLNTTSPFSSTVSVIVAQRASQGVWEFNRTNNTWAQLTSANASLLAADPQGDVVGEFPGYGLWEYRPAGGWKQLNGVDATALVMAPDGEVVSEFPGYGVGAYLPAFGWRSLTGANASLLAVDANGNVAGEFPGYGVWEFLPSGGWTQLNGVDVTLLAMNAQGDLVANFPGYGVGEYLAASGWQLLNGTEARALAVDANGAVAADFPGYGVGEYFPDSGWRVLTEAHASLLATDAFGELIGAFVG
jgi:hypothetical protein